jgi:hypothetical protein
LFQRHEVELFQVCDGEKVALCRYIYVADGVNGTETFRPNNVVKKPDRFLFNFNDGVRNIGFLAALKLVKDLDVILTLDDDVYPAGNDPIQEHLDALNQRVPISWFSTASEYMRGFPYGVRSEAEVWVSHGVWNGVHDYDGPTQLVNGVKPATFYRGPIPRGVYTPVCGMNLAFKVKALDHLYFAPMGREIGFQRFADIWMGMRLVEALDVAGAAMVSGYSMVEHRRASNVFSNLEQEASGIVFNEKLWDTKAAGTITEAQRSYFHFYNKCLAQWKAAILEIKQAMPKTLRQSA